MSLSPQQGLTPKQKFLAENMREGEKYAGILLGQDGAPDQHLFLLPTHAESITWAKAQQWAHMQGGELPTRREQSLLFANLKGAFSARAYWSGDSYEGDSSFAWCQLFLLGTQSYYRKSAACRAVAVRRLILE